MSVFAQWAPAVILTLGAGLLHGVQPQDDMPLRLPLEAVAPDVFGAYVGQDQEVSEAEADVAGFSDYILRTYLPEESDQAEWEAIEAGAPWLSLYVGYYESQTQGSTIHSPKNCLPGGGWEPLHSTTAVVQGVDGTGHTVNRYILQRDDERALVLYWYQGRGRIAHNEYLVKLDLLKDAAVHRRSDEALVRIVVPIHGTEDAAFEQARDLARTVIPALERALPL